MNHTCIFAFLTACVVFCAFLHDPSFSASGIVHPVYPPTTTDTTGLKDTLSYLQNLDDTSLLALVPPQPGFYFVGCPNCNMGAQEQMLEWRPGLGDHVQCKYCKVLLPNDKYPENATVEVKTPNGTKHTFKVYDAPDGKRYWFEARRWFDQKDYLCGGYNSEGMIYRLALLGYLTKDQKISRRAAVLLLRFADTYPDYIIHFDYPFIPKRLYPDGKPEGKALEEIYGVDRAAKWYWWGYYDLAASLLKAYDLLLADEHLLSDSEKAHIENDLFKGMIQYVTPILSAHFTNMHPALWESLANASLVFGDPGIGENLMKYMRDALAHEYYYDGFWRETTPSYHAQTVAEIYRVIAQLHPELPIGDPYSDRDALNMWADKEFSDFTRTRQAYRNMLLPDGRPTPVADTWAVPGWYDIQPIMASKPVLMPGLGYAILGAGLGADQFQAHLNFTGKFGHSHYDSLSLLLYAYGEELFSDIGYTHTNLRCWPTSTESHSTVLIDQKGQSPSGPEKGRGQLLLYSAQDSSFQVVQAESLDAYPGVASTYRRLIAAIEPRSGTRYVVDIFDVAGGQRHDWILNGSADNAQTLEISDIHDVKIPLTPVSSLLPSGTTFSEPGPSNDGYDKLSTPEMYGFFNNLGTCSGTDGIVATFRKKENSGTGVRSWIVGGQQTTVYTADSPAIRGAREDNGALPNFRRQSLIVSRLRGKNQFIAVHCPFSGESSVKLVTRLKSDASCIALRIDRDGGVDYFFMSQDTQSHSILDKGMKFRFTGRVALASIDGKRYTAKIIDGTEFVVNSKSLKLKKPNEMKLLGIQGNEIIVKGAVKCNQDDVIIMRHGDERTNAFHVVNVKYLNGNTYICSVEPALLAGEASASLSMSYFPQSVYPAPHSIYIPKLSVERWHQ